MIDDPCLCNKKTTRYPNVDGSSLLCLAETRHTVLYQNELEIKIYDSSARYGDYYTLRKSLCLTKTPYRINCRCCNKLLFTEDMFSDICKTVSFSITPKKDLVKFCANNLKNYEINCHYENQ